MLGFGPIGTQPLGVPWLNTGANIVALRANGIARASVAVSPPRGHAVLAARSAAAMASRLAVAVTVLPIFTRGAAAAHAGAASSGAVSLGARSASVARTVPTLTPYSRFVADTLATVRGAVGAMRSVLWLRASTDEQSATVVAPRGNVSVSAVAKATTATGGLLLPTAPLRVAALVASVARGNVIRFMALATATRAGAAARGTLVERSVVNLFGRAAGQSVSLTNLQRLLALSATTRSAGVARSAASGPLALHARTVAQTASRPTMAPVAALLTLARTMSTGAVRLVQIAQLKAMARGGAVVATTLRGNGILRGLARAGAATRSAVSGAVAVAAHSISATRSDAATRSALRLSGLTRATGQAHPVPRGIAALASHTVTAGTAHAIVTPTGALAARTRATARAAAHPDALVAMLAGRGSSRAVARSAGRFAAAMRVNAVAGTRGKGAPATMGLPMTAASRTAAHGVAALAGRIGMAARSAVTAVAHTSVRSIYALAARSLIRAVAVASPAMRGQLAAATLVSATLRLGNAPPAVPGVAAVNPLGTSALGVGGMFSLTGVAPNIPPTGTSGTVDATGTGGTVIDQ